LPPIVKANAAAIASGKAIYADSCVRCHGPEVSYTGLIPDLRQSPVIQDSATFRAVIAGGRVAQGMPDFSKWITPVEADDVRAYVVQQAHKLYESEQSKSRQRRDSRG
jgi:mono/diheme cytochrome c family protein